ncbi:E3 ubiquitin-protein ligase hel2-like [Lolium rigidum]|uniref:E3 ubiquitin-protein ligase hel2-like n=1 Tax=Lolium rigidum TaxID=89674 RepID=UPI001F5D1DF5|nr:E3 ubiquitin-protein ligase hel2-like [Lolium rigidum]
MDDACAVCAEPLQWVAYGVCGHREVCPACVARLRFVLRDHRCCICMTHCPAVFATKALGDRTKLIGDFSALPAVAGEGKAGEYWYHEATQVWFDDVDQYRTVRALCQFSCTVCKDSAGTGTGSGKKGGGKASKAKHKKKIGSIEQLKVHLFDHHHLYMCDLCLDGRKVFSCDQKLYTKPQLNKHIKNGDSEVDGSKVERRGFVGHPMCGFCKIPFYGKEELYSHVTREHFSCHICQRQQRGQEYFMTYDELEMHFRSDHFFCEDRECLEKKFIVFQSEAELKRHNAVEHRERKSHAKRTATFKASSSHNCQILGRGSGNQVASVAAPVRASSGQASQSGQSCGTNRVLQQSYSSLLSHQEVHGARIGSGLQEVSPPPISEQSRYTPALSWSSQTAASIRDEEFPPLSGTSNRSPALTQQGVRKVAENTHPSGLRQQSKGIVNIHHSVQIQSPENTDSTPSGSRHSPSCPTLNPSPNISGSLSLTSAENERRAANNFLVEKVQTALGMDRDRYAIFKVISGEYRQGVISASSYLLYVEQFGLSHLVLEMARLLPGPQKQKELVDAYYASLRLRSLQGNGGGGTVSSRKNKGKGKLPDAAETTGAARVSLEDQILRAANKLQLQGGDSGVLLKEGCGATMKGSRQSHGGQRLSLSKTKK